MIPSLLPSVFPSLILELSHFDGVNCALVPLVSEPSATAVLCLLQVVRGEQPVDDGDVLCGVEMRNAVGDPLADIVEVRCLSPDDASEDDDGIESVVLGHLLRSVDQLEAAGNRLDVDVLRESAMLLKCLDGSVKESIGDFRIPLGYDDAKAHVARVRYALCIVVG